MQLMGGTFGNKAERDLLVLVRRGGGTATVGTGE